MNTYLTNAHIDQIERMMNSHMKVKVDTCSGKSFQFTMREIRFLDALRTGRSLEDAMKQVGINLDDAYEILNKNKTKQYLGELAYERIQAERFTSEKWINEGLRVWKGEKTVDRQQMTAWQELGSRVSPRSGDGHGQEKVIININMDALNEAKRRVETVEAQVVEENVPRGTMAEDDGSDEQP